MADSFPTSWTNPNYVAAVVGILAFSAVIFYAGLTEGPPSPQMVMWVVLAIFVPVTIAYEVVRRW